jgi:hypothetical protein
MQRDNLFPGKSSKRKRELFNRVRAWCELNRTRLEDTAYAAIEELVVPTSHSSVVAVASLLEACLTLMFPTISLVGQAHPKEVRAMFGIGSKRGEGLSYSQRKQKSVDVIERNGYFTKETMLTMRRHFMERNRVRVDQLEAFLLARYCQALVASGSYHPTYTLNPKIDSKMYLTRFTPCLTEQVNLKRKRITERANRKRVKVDDAAAAAKPTTKETVKKETVKKETVKKETVKPPVKPTEMKEVTVKKEEKKEETVIDLTDLGVLTNQEGETGYVGLIPELIRMDSDSDGEEDLLGLRFTPEEEEHIFKSPIVRKPAYKLGESHVAT